MKRFCMIEIMMILGSFLALIKHLPILANVIMFSSIGLILLLNQKIHKCRVVLGGVGLFLLMHMLAEYGDLYALYDGLNGVLVFLSIHLNLMYEYLENKHNISEAFQPFLIFIIFTFIMLLTAILLKDNAMLMLAYPSGTLSILILIMLMCMPYLMTFACSFLMHN